MSQALATTTAPVPEVVEEKSEIDLSIFEAVYLQDTVELSIAQPLLMSLISGVERRKSLQVPTLGVRFDAAVKRWMLVINPEFYLSLNKQQRIAVLCHEAWHVLLMHPIRMQALPKGDWDIGNMAADVLVNHYIPDMKSTMAGQGCFYDSFDLRPEDRDTMEIIYEKIKKKAKKVNYSIQRFDDHSWEVSATDEKGNPIPLSEQAKQELKQLVETSVQANPQSFGNMHHEVQRYVKSMLRPKISWRKHLRVFGQASVKKDRKFVLKKPSRRFGFPNPGKGRITGGRVLVGVDVSGSVSEDWKKQFLAELGGMTRECEVEVVAFDTQISQRIKRWRKGMALGDTMGGTDPQCVFDDALRAKVKPSSIVILTDGYFGPVDTKGFKTLFVITPDGEMRKEAKSIRLE